MHNLRSVVCGVGVGLVFAACAHPTDSVRPEKTVSQHAEASAPSSSTTSHATPPSAPSPAPEVATPAPPPEPAPPPPPHLEGPDPAVVKKLYDTAAPAKKGGHTHVAIVTELSVPLYDRPDGRVVIGYSAIGSRIPATPLSSSCDGGTWFKVSGGAYLCSARGVEIFPSSFRGKVLDAIARTRVAKLNRATPYRNAKARRSAPLFKRMPTAGELAKVDAGEVPKELVDRTLEGTYLLTVVREVKDGPEPFLQLLTGEYIRKKDLKPFPPPPMHGEKLGDDVSLPLAFTWDKTRVFCLGDEDPVRPCGTADKHARFPAEEIRNEDGDRFVIFDDHLAVKREKVRVARATERPAGVDDDEQWIHIDLTEQTLVAYEGDDPVYATLVSTGKRGHDTPRGLYQVYRSYLTKVMNGTDEDGPYSVQEVPWTMYFRGNYAVHGAYWHDVFGNTRSHGCVNVPPIDARWLFYWARPQLPRGWSASLRVKGPRVYITGETPPDMPESPDA